MRPPLRLEIGGESPWASGPIDLGGVPVFNAFSIDWLDTSGNIAFHLQPRPDDGIVALNSFLVGAWGEETTIGGYPFPREPERTFRLGFDVLADRFRVSVDGTFLTDFRHCVLPSELTEVRATAFFWRLEESAEGLRAFAPEIVPASRLGGWSQRWVRAEPNPVDAAALESFGLFAILGTWLEEDVVADTVSNCFRQGCDRVFLVDNDSPDATVERAVGAGATLARSFRTDSYDEVARIAVMQEVVDEVSPQAPVDHVWWLWLDADEFHHGPLGLTLRDYLATLDRRFRVVGARLFNHLPSGAPAHRPGRHPLDDQPLCYEIPAPSCELGHSNHPLQRWDREGPPIVATLGAHMAESENALLEPEVPTFFHHFPYRSEASTRRRLQRLFGFDGTADRMASDASPTGAPARFHHSHLRARQRSLDAVYGRRWNEVTFHPPSPPGFVPELRSWEEWVGPLDRNVARWY